jgi:hypothetical protein
MNYYNEYDRNAIVPQVAAAFIGAYLVLIPAGEFEQ